MSSLYQLFETRNYLFRHAYKHKTTHAVDILYVYICITAELIIYFIFLLIRIRDALKKADEFITIPGENKLVIDCTECLYLVSTVLLKRYQRLLMIWLLSHY